jgi:hypothetical protein
MKTPSDPGRIEVRRRDPRPARRRYGQMAELRQLVEPPSSQHIWDAPEQQQVPPMGEYLHVRWVRKLHTHSPPQQNALSGEVSVWQGVLSAAASSHVPFTQATQVPQSMAQQVFPGLQMLLQQTLPAPHVSP